MISFTFKLRDKLFQRYLHKVERRLPIYCYQAVKNVAEYIDRVAMMNLQSSLGTGYTNQRWGHSTEIPIGQSQIYTNLSTPKEVRIRLTYDTPHSWVVEHGGLGRVTSKDKSYPIGKSNFGEPIAFRESFKIQRGYHFLDNAVENPETQRYMERETLKAVKKATRKWF